MAEYYAVLKKAVSGMDGGAGDARRSVYDKARNALIGQLKAIDPPLSTSEISRQRLELEEAIRRVEREAAAEAQSSRGRAVDSVREAVSEPSGPSPQDVFRRAIQEAESRASAPVPARADTGFNDGRSMRDRIERAPPPDSYQEQEPPRGRRQQPQLAPDYDDDWQQARAAPAPQAEPYVDRRDRPATRQPPRKERARSGGYREDEGSRPPQRAPRRSRLPAILITVLILGLLVGLAALAYSRRDLIASFIGEQDKTAAESVPVAEPEAPAATAAESSKDSARLGEQGAADPGVRSVGDDSQQASLPEAGGQDQQAIGQALTPQKATLYEEPIGGESASAGTVTAIAGGATWQLVQGTDGPEIVANVNIPDRSMKLKVTIRKNADASLPASHLVEIVVNTGANFAGKNIRTVPRLVMKAAEDARGQALVGASAKVADGLFWIALSAAENDINNNLKMLRENAWIDVPIVYGTNQRAILTFEKGATGAEIFRTAMESWGQAAQQ
ncbi:MAG: hypothetical protein ABI399_04415 [Bauldia sp.]